MRLSMVGMGLFGCLVAACGSSAKRMPLDAVAVSDRSTGSADIQDGGTVISTGGGGGGLAGSGGSTGSGSGGNQDASITGSGGAGLDGGAVGGRGGGGGGGGNGGTQVGSGGSAGAGSGGKESGASGGSVGLDVGSSGGSRDGHDGGGVGTGGNGSALDARGGEAGDKATRKRIFHLKNGTLGQIRDGNDTRTGLEVADAECVQAGQSYGGGQWKAWLSSSTINALDRLADVGPWYRVDQETLLFPSRAAMVNGPLAPIDTQSDPVDDRRNLFWSGTLAAGSASGSNCQDWTAYGSGLVATVGRVDTAGQGWVNPSSLSCGSYLSLLCIEQ